MTGRGAEASYDEVPYTAHAFTESHPGRLAATAVLLGLSPPEVATSRILEIGCARGGNLLPMARGLPGATLLGVDISGIQIAEAKKLAAESHLDNVQFTQLDIVDFPKGAGTFDYIICHGVLSWVPEPVRGAILDVIARHLAPQGVAFVSYNVDPGFRVRSLSRDILRFYAEGIEGTVLERLAAARQALAEIAKGDEKGAYHEALREEVELLQHTSEAYIVHEHLEDHNVPLRFQELADFAAARGLSWLSEAPYSKSWPVNLPAENLAGQPEARILRAQQELDFRSGRAFRRSLLTQKTAATDRVPLVSRMPDLFVRSAMKPEGELSLREGVAVTFRARVGAIEIDDAFSKAAFGLLGSAYPRAFSVRALAAEAWERAGRPASVADPVRSLSTDLLQLHRTTDMVDLLAWDAAAGRTLPERPVLPAYLRERIAEDGGGTTLFHDNFKLDDPFFRAFVRSFDGTRTSVELRARGRALAAEMGLEPHDRAGKPIADAAKRQERIGTIIDDIFALLVNGCYFEGPASPSK